MVKRKQVKKEPPPDTGGFNLGQQLEVESQPALQHQIPLHGQQDEELPSYDDATAFAAGTGAMLPLAGPVMPHTVMGTIMPQGGSEQEWAAAPPPSYDEVVGAADHGGMPK